VLPQRPRVISLSFPESHSGSATYNIIHRTICQPPERRPELPVLYGVRTAALPSMRPDGPVEPEVIEGAPKVLR
jgi:hypothetical protein